MRKKKEEASFQHVLTCHGFSDVAIQAINVQAGIALVCDS